MAVGVDGMKIAARTVPHTAEDLSEWDRELDQWRAQGTELWAAIERREGRVVDFLLDQDVVVYPVNPKALVIGIKLPTGTDIKRLQALAVAMPSSRSHSARGFGDRFRANEGAVAPRGHRIQSRQSPAPGWPASRHLELVPDEPPATALQDRRSPDPACPVLQAPTRRELLDAAPLWADPRTHRAARVAPDVIEMTARVAFDETVAEVNGAIVTTQEKRSEAERDE